MSLLKEKLKEEEEIKSSVLSTQNTERTCSPVSIDGSNTSSIIDLNKLININKELKDRNEELELCLQSKSNRFV